MSVSPSTVPLLEVANLSVSVPSQHGGGERTILHDVSFRLDARESVSILGPNGAGKSTLLKTLLGLYPHFKGNILWEGQSLQCVPPRQRAQWIAYVPQNQPMDAFCTVREFVALGRYAYSRRFAPFSETNRRLTEEALAQTALLDFADQPLSALSGGERQKALIAAALCQSPRLLVLDEPATFLDPHNQAGIYHLLNDIRNQREIAILAVTHDIPLALQSSTRLLGMKNGRIISEGRTEEWRDPAWLGALFDLPFFSLSAPDPGNSHSTLPMPRWMLERSPYSPLISLNRPDNKNESVPE